MVGVRLIKKICIKTNMNFEEICQSKKELNDLLKQFYAGARTEKGEKYKNNSLSSFRSSLRRYFLDEMKIDIFNDETFTESNILFKNILKGGEQSGFGDTEHYEEIEPKDLRKLSSSFNIDTPEGLQEFIWFNVLL